MNTFLFIHGGMQGGWCWSRLLPLLEGEGRQMIAPCLFGLGTKAHFHAPTLNLSTHIQGIVNIIDKDSLQNVILVGHSYGGMVATGAAAQRPDAIKHTIYLDAVLAEPGQSMATAILPEIWEGLHKKALHLGEGWQVPAMTTKDYGLEADVDKAFIQNQSTPQSIASFIEPLYYDLDLHEKIPSLYIHCQKSTFLSNMEDRSKNMRIDFQTINAGHFVMIEAPDLLASYLKKYKK